MRDLNSLTFHPVAEKIVEVLCKKTQNINPKFFRILTSYYLAKITAMMRVKIATRDRGDIPVNTYAINLASSGHGKGYATNIIEEQVINQFRSIFFDQTYPVIVERNLAKLAAHRAAIKQEDQDTMEVTVTTEFENLGTLAFSFDSATTAAVKQMRHKLLMGGIGSMNLEIDEIGSNLLGNSDVLTTMLELFDVGKIKQKLTKNTKENVRNEEIEGKTPTNLLLFGTPSKLLNGGKTENEFVSFLDTGYARRCIFGYARSVEKDLSLSINQIYDMLTDTNTEQFLKDISLAFSKLANVTNYDKTILVDKDVSLLNIEYRVFCEKQAAAMPEHKEIAKAEMAHRYFKAMKLAGAYAFIDGAPEISKDNYYAAVCLVEESGNAFKKILTRDRNYVRLAKFIASVDHEVTHVELDDDLPFYHGSNAFKQDLMQMAIAWGHKNHVVIKRSMSNGIEFISGETLQKTDLDKLAYARSSHAAFNYKNGYAPWDQLYILTQLPNMNFVSHHVSEGHRDKSHTLPGFDMLVLDIDAGTSIQTAKHLLQNYKYLLYTTKRHTNQAHRFRLILPMNYHLKLTDSEYSTFMENVLEWLPFEVDAQANQRERKWLTCPGNYVYGSGKDIVDARLFIPKTAKNDKQKQVIQTYQSLTNMERWFVQNTHTNQNRNNQLVRYGFLLVDMGYDLVSIKDQIIALNKKLPDKLPLTEITDTIMRSVAKSITKKGLA